MMLVMVLVGSSYICTINAASNTANSKPNFTSVPPPIKRVSEGEIVKIGAKATGAPAPEYRWYKDDIRIYAGDKYSISYDNGATELTINDTKPSDSGKYEVVAENLLGKDEKTCELTVLPK